MAKNKPIVAICYDFDGTLSPGNMQEYGFFSGLGDVAKNFWAESEAQAKGNNADPILYYMRHMIEKASIGNIGTTQKDFRAYGKSVELFQGVAEWFNRIKAYGANQGITVEHYIVSSGLYDMIKGSPIGKEFKNIYACSFVYDNNNAAKWPAVAVNYTTKTQFLFRINKGIKDNNDHAAVNRYIEDTKRRVPFSRMIYIGDGQTDIPCMKLVKDKGGFSIAVFNPEAKRKKILETQSLLKEGRVNFTAEADYREDGRMDQLIKSMINLIASQMRLDDLGRTAKAKSPRTQKLAATFQPTV